MFSRLFASIVFVTPFVAFASSEVNWSICESGSQCGKCIEQGSIVVERKGDRIELVGKNPLGVTVADVLKGCEIKTDKTWACVGGRMRLTRVGNRITMEYIGKPITIDGNQYDFCSVQVR